jgi:hypothetical protein
MITSVNPVHNAPVGPSPPMPPPPMLAPPHPCYCCCSCYSGWMLLCALFWSVKLYPLVNITSRKLFLFWDLSFRTWTNRQTNIVVLIYRINSHCLRGAKCNTCFGP